MSTKVEEIVNRVWMVRERGGVSFLMRGKPNALSYSLGFPTGADYLGEPFVYCHTKTDAMREARFYRMAQRKQYGKVRFPVDPVLVTVTWEVTT